MVNPFTTHILKLLLFLLNLYIDNVLTATRFGGGAMLLHGTRYQDHCLQCCNFGSSKVEKNQVAMDLITQV